MGEEEDEFDLIQIFTGHFICNFKVKVFVISSLAKIRNKVHSIFIFNTENVFYVFNIQDKSVFYGHYGNLIQSSPIMEEGLVLTLMHAALHSLPLGAAVAHMAALWGTYRYLDRFGCSEACVHATLQTLNVFFRSDQPLSLSEGELLNLDVIDVL